MKRFIKTSVAAAFAVVSVGTTAALAQPYQPPPPYYQHYNGGPPPGYHHWHHGDRFYGNRHIVDWRYHHLYQPPYGYAWVDGRNAFLLLNLGNGYIANVVPY